MTAGLTARLDTIAGSIEIASGPQRDSTAGYTEWHDAVCHILDSTPPLVAALRAVLDLHNGNESELCDECTVDDRYCAWPCPTYAAVAAALEES